jgi:hypothetical protein
MVLIRGLSTRIDSIYIVLLQSPNFALAVKKQQKQKQCKNKTKQNKTRERLLAC